MPALLASLRHSSDPDPVECAAAAEIYYQPIVSTASLRAHGFEALARMPEDGRFADVLELLDAGFAADCLRSVEQTLITKAMKTFAALPGATEFRLFCNVDNRVFDDERIDPEIVVDIIKASGLQPSNICIELSERKPPLSIDAMSRVVEALLRHNMRLALDDFGQGFSGLDTLMRVDPHYVKIDRAFINGVSASRRQQAIVSKVAGLAHSLGYLVVAEGVETESDFRTARDLGCDLAQGYLISRPVAELGSLRADYGDAVADDVRSVTMPRQVAELLTDIEPVELGGPISVVVERFKDHSAVDFVPVVDSHRNVHGAVYKGDLRFYLFGDFGSALINNKGLDQRLDRFVRRCAMSEANVPTDAMIDAYVAAGGSDGVVLTLDGKYAGVLPNYAMFKLAADREVAIARDQNPLTLLPGNNSINRHLTEILSSSRERTVVFFDFDHFKAFNDAYGFAVGDRALLMFADLLVAFRHANDAFVGHIGGDDFFASIPRGPEASTALVRDLVDKFRNDVESLYLMEDRAQRGLWAKDRFGETRFLPLLRASAAILPLPTSRSHFGVAEIVTTLATGKTAAKASVQGVQAVCLPETAVAGAVADLARRLDEAG